MKTLSIIVPVYNAAATLEECLGALRNIRGFEECELIVADDNSTDSSVNIAEKYADKIVRSQENKGAAFNRNLGAKSGNGKFLLFVDSDVVLSSADILSYLKEDFTRNDICGIVGIYEEKMPFNNFSSIYKHLYMCYGRQTSPKFSSVVSSAILAVSRKNFFESGGFNESFPGVTAEDIDFTIKSALKINKLWWFDERIRGYHLKKYSLFSLLKTNHARVKGIAKATQEKEYKISYLKSCFVSSVSPLSAAMISAMLFFLSFFSFIFFWGGLFFLFLFFVLQVRFFKYLKKMENTAFALLAVCFSFLEMLHAVGCVFYWQLVYMFKKS